MKMLVPQFPRALLGRDKVHKITESEPQRSRVWRTSWQSWHDSLQQRKKVWHSNRNTRIALKNIAERRSMYWSNATWHEISWRQCRESATAGRPSTCTHVHCVCWLYKILVPQFPLALSGRDKVQQITESEPRRSRIWRTQTKSSLRNAKIQKINWMRSPNDIENGSRKIQQLERRWN